ncbi:acyltransferase [Gordonia sinesedis]
MTIEDEAVRHAGAPPERARSGGATAASAGAGSPGVAPTPPRRFYPQLEGMRALAALGVLTTHVAFQTGAVRWPVLGPIFGRLDLAVALFFALSGFLLWRPWAAAAHASTPRPRVRRYLRHRVVRIWPAYLVVVVIVLLLLPEARSAGVGTWVANLTLTQVFVPLSLTAGLTQMWSLSVEVAFYALLPILGTALVRLRGSWSRWRVPLLAAVGLASLGWAWVAAALPVPGGVEPTNWVFGHLSWFVAGLLLAEVAAAAGVIGAAGAGASSAHDSRAHRLLVAAGSHRWLMAGVFVISYGLACTPLAGPTGLGVLSSWQFAVKMALGAVCAFALLAPLITGTGPFRFLTSPVMLALGRWSYGIFIWHVAVLAIVFPLFGIVPFAGDTVLVWLLTVVLTVGLSAASYAFIEEPARAWLRRREAARHATREASSPQVSALQASAPQASAPQESMRQATDRN